MYITIIVPTLTSMYIHATFRASQLHPDLYSLLWAINYSVILDIFNVTIRLLKEQQFFSILNSGILNSLHIFIEIFSFVKYKAQNWTL